MNEISLFFGHTTVVVKWSWGLRVKTKVCEKWTRPHLNTSNSFSSSALLLFGLITLLVLNFFLMFQNGTYSLENFILVLTLKFVSKKFVLVIDEYKRDIYLEKFSGFNLNVGLSLACLLNKRKFGLSNPNWDSTKSFDLKPPKLKLFDLSREAIGGGSQTSTTNASGSSGGSPSLKTRAT